MGGGHGNQLGQGNYDLKAGASMVSLLYTIYYMYGLWDIPQDGPYVQSTRDYQIDGS